MFSAVIIVFLLCGHPRLAQDPLAHLGFAQLFQALRQRQVRDGFVARPALERMAHVPPEEHAERPPGDERHDLRAALPPVRRGIHLVAPPVRSPGILRRDERGGEPGLERQGADPVHLLRDDLLVVAR